MAAATRFDAQTPGIRRLLRSAFPGTVPAAPAPSAPTPMSLALQRLDSTLDDLAAEAERLEGLLARAHTTGPLVAAFRVEMDGASVVFTRAVSLPLEQRADRYGFSCRSRVTSTTDLLVLGAPPVSPVHLQRARTCGVRVIEERAFWARLGEDR